MSNMAYNVYFSFLIDNYGMITNPIALTDYYDAVDIWCLYIQILNNINLKYAN